MAWPTRTVKVVVPYAPGGVTDTMARITADRLGKMLGQTFFIETRPGAGGSIGVEYALHSAHDGYTILFVGSTLFTVLPLAQKVNYEPLKDFVPLSITGTNGMVFIAPNDAPYSTLREFIKAGIEMPPGTVIMEDPPSHDINRALLARLFAPRRVAALEPKIREFIAKQLDPRPNHPHPNESAPSLS